MAAGWTQAGADRSELWTYALSVPQGSTEGTYTLTFWAQDCGGTTHLTTTASVSYVVDNTSPAIYFLTPLDRGNLYLAETSPGVFDTAPIAAKVVDAGPANVDAARITLALIDESLPSRPTTTYTGSQVSWTSTSGWAKTADLAFTQGHVYRIEATAYDRAGNRADAAHVPYASGGGLLAMSGTHSGTASITKTCTVSDTIKLNGMRDVTCPDVDVTIAGKTTLSGTRHDGVGGVIHEFTLANAVLADPALGSVEVQAFPAGHPALAERTITTEFRAASACPSPSGCALTGKLGLGTLATEVLGTWAWSTAILKMGAATETEFDACDDPTTASSLTCVPDPVRVLAPANTNVRDFDVRGKWEAVVDDDTVSAPIIATAPAWFTPAFAQRVYDTNGGEVVAPLGPGESAPAEVGLRPGSIALISLCPISVLDCSSPARMLDAVQCTFDFVFQSAGVLAIGMAGHCIVGHPDHLFIDVLMLNAQGLPVVREVSTGSGTLARWYCQEPTSLCDGDNDIDYRGQDFVLLDINDSLVNDGLVFAATAGVGGPCGKLTSGGDDGEVLVHSYAGGAFVARGPVHAWDPYWVDWQSVAFETHSGSPVLRDANRQAVGILTRSAILECGVNFNNCPVPSQPFPLALAIGARMSAIDFLLGAAWALLDDPSCV